MRVILLEALKKLLIVRNAEFDVFPNDELYFILGNRRIVTAGKSIDELTAIIREIVNW